MRTQKYRLRPNVSQTVILDLWLRLCCGLYNAALEQRILGWAKIRREVPRDKTDEGAKLFKQKLTRYGQQSQLTELRAADECWAKAPAELLRSALHRLDLAYASFFRRVSNGETPGFPRFRAVRRYASFSTSRASVRGDRLFIPKLGHVKMNLYRPIRGEIKNVVIRRDATGKWWASLQCDLGEAPPKVPVVNDMAGIDLGLKTLAMLSTGEVVPNPRFSRRSAEILARRQQTLARKQKQSANRERQRQLVAKAHAHIANQRVDHARYYAKQLFERFDALAYEDLSIRALACSMLSKSFADASWGVLLRCLASKAEEAGEALGADGPQGDVATNAASAERSLRRIFPNACTIAHSVD